MAPLATLSESEVTIRRELGFAEEDPHGSLAAEADGARGKVERTVPVVVTEAGYGPTEAVADLQGHVEPAQPLAELAFAPGPCRPG